MQLDKPMPSDETYVFTSASVLRVPRGPQKLAVPSSVFEPARMDIFATSPSSKLSEGRRGTMAPSTTGVKTNSADALKTSSYGACRRQSRVSAESEQPTVFVMLWYIA